MSAESPSEGVDKTIEAVTGAVKWRRLTGMPYYFQSFLLAAVTILSAAWSVELQHLFGLAIFKEQFLAVIFGLSMAAVFLSLKPYARAGGDTIPWFDWILVAMSLVSGLFVTVNYREIVNTLGDLTPARVALGAATIFIVFEATRRFAGWTLVFLGVVFIGYSAVSHLAPGLLNVPSSSPQRIAAYLYLDSNSLFGVPLDVTTSIIVAFILFGRMLYAANGDRFLTDFALATMGRYRGGPAKVAVLASSFFGTISGSAVSNVAMSGPITIPMMRRAGYPGPTAAGIEAVASTGGQIMPPVMGIVAFLLAEFLNVSYGEVIVAAVLSAIMYYLALFVQVDLEAAKQGLKGLAKSDLPLVRDIIGRGWVFILPIVLLIWTLVAEHWAPGRSAMLAAGATLAVAVLSRATRPSLAKLWNVIRGTGETVLELVIITSLAGMVIGSLQISGLSFNFSLVLIALAGGSSLSLLLMTAFVCIILGMGMPSGVIYIMLAILVAPALIESGILPMASHLFIFYFGMLSMITPPICIATFAACAVAHTSFWPTGWAGVRLGIAAYVIPFVFVYQPALLFEGSALEVVLVAVKTAIGVSILAVAMAGYLFGPIAWPARVVVLLCGCAVMFIPLQNALSLLAILAAIVVPAALGWRQKNGALAKDAVRA